MKILDAQEICLKISMAFEGTNYTGLEGSFDGAGFTFGIIGFNLKYGTLQDLLKKMYAADKVLFTKCCTVFVPAYKENRDLTPIILSMLTLSDEDAVGWSLARQSPVNHQPDSHWKEVFKNLGQQVKFQEIQRKTAAVRFNKALTYCKQYNVNTVRGLMLFYDCTVQQGSIKENTATRIAKRITGSTDYKARLRICAEEMANQAADRWHDDVLNRRLAIVNGKGKVHGKNWDLDKEYHLSDENIV